MSFLTGLVTQWMLQTEWKLSLTCSKLLFPYFPLSFASMAAPASCTGAADSSEPQWLLKNNRALEQWLFKLTSVGVKCQALTGEWCWLRFWTDNRHKSPGSTPAFVLSWKSPWSELPRSFRCQLGLLLMDLSCPASSALMGLSPSLHFPEFSIRPLYVWPEGPVFYT